MASNTLLSLVQEFCELRGLVAPTVVAASTDATIKQMRRLLNEGMRELRQRQDWKCMQVLSPIVTPAVSATYQAYDLQGTLPDYRWMIPNTLWETTTRLPVAGPLSEVERSALITMQVTNAQYSFWIGSGLVGDALYIYPYSASSRFQFQYQSSYCWITALSAPIESASGDTDKCLFPTDIVLADLKWRWNYTKGFPYAEELRSFEGLVQNYSAREANAGEINMGDPRFDRFVAPGLLIAAGSWRLP